ncbi:hypothetical protein STEG23_034874, partial [Scotinomys teguina]
MTQQLKAVAALAEDLYYIPNTHIPWLTTDRNVSSKGSPTLFWMLSVKEAMQRIHDRGNIGKLILDVEKTPTPLMANDSTETSEAGEEEEDHEGDSENKERMPFIQSMLDSSILDLKPHPRSHAPFLLFNHTCNYSIE